jgi:protein tyrosine/serine phosphatase
MQTCQRIFGVPGVSNFGTVADGIYRSARPEIPLGYSALKAREVKTVLSLEGEQDHDAVVAAGMESRFVALEAFEPVPIEKFNSILAIIDAAPRPILIHCLQGHDRTGVVCAAYRITHGWSLEDAIEEMDSYGFNHLWVALMNSLKEWAKQKGISG